MSKGRRRGFVSWFVEPYKQVKLGLMFLVVNGIFSVLILGTFGYYVYDIFFVVKELFKLSGTETAITFQKFAVPLIAGGGLMILFILTTILVSVRYTHEIYGPLVSIHRYLDEVLMGQRPSKIQLRDSDQLQDLATKLNDVADRLVTDQRAGPMVAIHRFLDEWLEGKDPRPISLRESDVYAELAEKLNALRDKAAQK